MVHLNFNYTTCYFTGHTPLARIAGNNRPRIPATNKRMDAIHIRDPYSWLASHFPATILNSSPSRGTAAPPADFGRTACPAGCAREVLPQFMEVR